MEVLTDLGSKETGGKMEILTNREGLTNVRRGRRGRGRRRRERRGRGRGEGRRRGRRGGGEGGEGGGRRWE